MSLFLFILIGMFLDTTAIRRNINITDIAPDRRCVVIFKVV